MKRSFQRGLGNIAVEYPSDTLLVNNFVAGFVAGKQQQAAPLQPRLTTDQLSSLHTSFVMYHAGGNGSREK
jgi:hypothetical protein